MLSSKKLTTKGTLRQVFITVYRLEIQTVMRVFRPSFVHCCPLTFSLVQLFSLPPFPVWISILFTRKQYVRGGGWGSGPQTDKHLPQNPFTDYEILHCLLWVFSFYGSDPSAEKNEVITKHIVTFIGCHRPNAPIERVWVFMLYIVYCNYHMLLQNWGRFSLDRTFNVG